MGRDLFKEIIAEFDIQIIKKKLWEHEFYEHFFQQEVESVVSFNLMLQVNDSWITKLKSKMKNF